jgi:type I restriction enzyme, S subunit
VKAGPFGSAITKSLYVPSGYKVYGQEQVLRGDHLYGDYFVSAGKFAELKSCSVAPGDVLMTLVGTVGRVLVVPKDALPGIINPRLIRFSLDQQRVFPAFFGALLETDILQQRLSRYAQGGTMGVLNAGMLKPLTIPVPGLAEQRAIANVVMDAESLVRAEVALIAKKRDLRQAVIQQLLSGRVRLPGFSEVWRQGRLGAVGRCLRGVSYHPERDLSSYDTDQTVRLLRSNNIQDASVRAEDVQFVHRERVSEQQVLRSLDIVICMANGSKFLVGKAALFQNTDHHTYTFGAFMGCFRVSASVAHAQFVSVLFQTARYRRYISNLLAGSSINNLTPTTIESLEFAFPPVAEQEAIASVLSDMDAEIVALEQRLAKTRALKQGMMQALLTGRVRLVGAEVAQAV